MITSFGALMQRATRRDPLETGSTTGHSAPRAPAGLSYRADIDGLRALAVIPVLLYHAGVSGFTGGYVGVDVFFVISGFLITSIVHAEILAGRFSLVRFYERRIRRLLPALVAVIAVTTLLSVWLLLPTQLKDFGQSLLSVALFASNVLFWKEAGYFDAPAELKPLLHTWSLSVEEQFYLFFPPLLYVICTKLPRRVGAVILGGLLASLAANIILTGPYQNTTFFLLPFRAWELLIGAFLALGMLPKPASRRDADICGVVGLLLIAGSVVLYTPSTPFPGLAAVPPVLGAALIIHAGTFPGAVAGRLLSTAPMVAIGLISYSLYLWHWPIIVFTKYVTAEALTPVLQVAVVVASLVAAGLSWRWIEKPFRHPATPVGRGRLFAAAGVTVAMFGIVGAGLHVARGLPSRVPAEVRPLVAAMEDFQPQPNSCRPWDRSDRRAAELCIIGGRGDRGPEFMMWGDSHGGILVHAIESQAERLGKSGLFSNLAGCPPLVGIAKDESVADAAVDAKCATLNTRIVEILRRSPGITKVLLVSRWSYYANGRGVGADAGNTVSIYREGSKPSPSGNGEVFEAALHATIETLVSMNKTVYVLRQVPEIEQFRPTALAASMMLARSSANAALIASVAQTPVARVEERQRAFTSAMGRWKGDPRVHVIDPWPYFCDARVCRAIQDGEARYFDNNHVTTGQARALAPLFTGMLEQR